MYVVWFEVFGLCGRCFGCGVSVVFEGMGRDQEIDEKAKNQSLANVLNIIMRGQLYNKMVWY